MANVNNDDSLLSKTNDQKATLMIPAILYITCLMIVGVIGNILVCVFYGCKSKFNTNSFFIIVLASFDLIICVITMPIEIIDLRFFYMFKNAPACKVARFVNSFATLGSAAILLAIAIDRYRRMCRPFKRQFHMKDAKIACLIAAILSVMFSWPTPIFYDSVSVNVTDPQNKSVILEGFDCTTTKSEEYKTYLLAFNVVQVMVFIVAVCMLGILYCMIGRVLYKHKRRWRKYASASGHLNGSCLESTDKNITMKPSSETDSAKKSNIDVKNAVSLSTKSGLSSATQPTWRESHANTKDQSPDIKTVKYTVIMLAVTVVFVLSFLPHLILIVWRLFQSQYEVDLLSDAGLVAFQIGIRSYLLNSAANPVLYGFFNPKFRTFFYEWFFPCFAKKTSEVQVSTSSREH